MARRRLLQSAALAERLDAALTVMIGAGGFSQSTLAEVQRRRRDAEEDLEHWAQVFTATKDG